MLSEMVDLAKKLYEGNFSVRIIHENDSYGHLHYDSYVPYADVVTDSFLRELGFSHKFLLTEKGVCLIHHGGKSKNSKELVKYDDVDVNLGVSLRRGIILELKYKFEKNGEDVFSYNSKWAFVDAKTKKPILAPDFFLDALKQKARKRKG